MKIKTGNLVLIAGIVSIIIATLTLFIRSNFLVSTAIYFFGLTSILIGIDAIKSKKIIMPSVYSRRLKETYKGMAAISHGVIFLLLGGFLIYLNYLSVNNSGSEFFKRAIKILVFYY